MADKTDQIRDQVMFQLHGLTNYGKFQDVNLSLKMGEIVGLAGRRGSGRTEIMKSVVGLDSFDEGTITLNGKPRRYTSPVAAFDDRVMYMAEEREAEGLVGVASIKHNLTASILNFISRTGILDRFEENKRSEALIGTMGVKCYSGEQSINQLSGGNKQKVMVGKILAASPLVCLLDEPTRGIDIEAKESILQTINEKMRQDSCVLITSPGIDDLIKICDRILVLYEGRIIDQFHRGQFNEEDIYRATQGEIIHGVEVSS
jgi:ABC-type sugar transport system ATPase subunit